MLASHRWLYTYWSINLPYLFSIFEEIISCDERILWAWDQINVDMLEFGQILQQYLYDTFIFLLVPYHIEHLPIFDIIYQGFGNSCWVVFFPIFEYTQVFVKFAYEGLFWRIMSLKLRCFSFTLIFRFPIFITWRNLLILISSVLTGTLYFLRQGYWNL